MNALKETVKNNRLIRHLYYFSKGVLSRKKLEAVAARALNFFNVDIPECEKQKVLKDMVKMYSRYGFAFDEYICYKFHCKNMQERLEFVADWEHLGYTCKLNDFKNAEVFDNKWKTFSKYGKYYGRSVVFCQGNDDEGAFEQLLTKEKKLIVKPLDASCGNGIKIIDNCDESKNAHELFEALLSEYNGSFIAEELIIQDPEMAKFHPSSVNTVRIPTIRMNDEIKIVHPFMRIGQNGKCVDNGGAGGILCSVDVETGKILAAADENAKIFQKHPNSGEQIVGFVIPRWEEAKQLVKKLAMVIPENRYSGWDLALTDNGWSLVEANRRGQFVWQIPSQCGFRKEINEILKKLGKKY